MRRARELIVAAPAACVVLSASLLLSACGGGTREDAGEPKASFDVKVLRASFPRSQAVARPATFVLEVQNTGTRAVPDVAVSVDSFNYTSNYAGLADDKRPIWAIERGPGPKAEPPVESQEVSIPGGGQTTYVNTWALGRLAPGQRQTFVWKVVAVKPGVHTVHYTFAADLAGKAKALPSAGSLHGALTVDVAPAPPATHVNPDTGRAEPGAYVPASAL